ncbi:hypothetical protein PWT90_06076 [Aphanocladium album]|nr:hypothetical protein PWT90_06076 [Aphanocladium album]
MSLPVSSTLRSEPANESHAGQDTTVPNAVRQKRWATKSRTGCFTCRESSKRHVKCDEATPACRRCQVGKLQCRYDPALVPLCDAKKADKAFALAPNTSRHQLQRNDGRILVEAELPDWDYLQTIRYCASSRARPARPTKNGKRKDPVFDLARAPFQTAAVITTQIGLKSKQYGRVLRFGEEPAAMSKLWASHAHYQRKILALANQNIQENTAAAKVRAFTCICQLTFDDLEVESIQWKSHIDGALAYLESIGGATAMANWSPKTPMAFIRFFRHIVYQNTTTPALRHSLGYNNYTDNQLEVFLDDTEFDSEMPFPVGQKLLLIHLTRLRYQVATSAISQSRAASIVLELFRRLSSIDVASWAHRIGGFGPAANQALARIHHDAVWLYAILALPRRVLLRWAETQPLLASDGGSPIPDALDRQRVLYRSRLLARIRRLHPELEYPAALSWPLVVAGVAAAAAAADGPEQDRDFVDGSLYAIWQRPVGNPCAFLCLTKLRAFWASGRTGWEDCFDEPTPC